MEPFNREFQLAEALATDTLVAFGSEMKVLEETADGWRVGGWAVVFGSHDVSRLKDRFEASTDYDFEDGARRSLFFNHGLDGTIKKTRLGEVQLQLKEAGVWYEGQLKKRTDYLKAHAERIAEGIKSGIFGTSTGAPAHLVEREKTASGHQVKMWPIAEVSITPTPAEPLTSCVSLKSLEMMETGRPRLEVLCRNLQGAVAELEGFLASQGDVLPGANEAAMAEYVRTMVGLSFMGGE